MSGSLSILLFVCLSVCSIARNFATEKHNSHEKRNPINYSVIIKDVVISPTDMQRALECGSLNSQNLARPDVALRKPGAVKTTEDITQSTKWFNDPWESKPEKIAEIIVITSVHKLNQIPYLKRKSKLCKWSVSVRRQMWLQANLLRQSFYYA